MEKIIFEDLPSTKTPLNAENLNQIQNNIENAIIEIDDKVKEINNKNIYSTEEQIIGIWLDKPLYRKVVDVGNLPENNTMEVAHGILNFGRMIKISGTVFSQTGNNFPLPYSSVDMLGDNIMVYCNAANIVIKTGSNRTHLAGYVILEYTKTTD